MANDEHVALLRQGVAAWNAWRHENPNILPDLSEANLSRGEPRRGANLSQADLSQGEPHRGEPQRGEPREANLTRRTS